MIKFNDGKITINTSNITNYNKQYIHPQKKFKKLSTNLFKYMRDLLGFIYSSILLKKQ